MYRQDIRFNPYFPLLPPNKQNLIIKRYKVLTDKYRSNRFVMYIQNIFYFLFFVVFFSLLVYRREEIVKWSRNVSKFCFYKEEEEEGRVLFLRDYSLIV